MPALDERQNQRREDELALARRLTILHDAALRSGHPRWNLAAFAHHPDPVGATFLAAVTGADSDFHVHLAEASGLGLVAGVLAAECILELLRRDDASKFASLNRHFHLDPPGDRGLLAAGALHFRSEGLEWTGTFAGLQAPILVDDSGRVELLMGTGPFLGLTDTTSPTIRGLLHPGKRLFLLAGSGAGDQTPALCERLANTPNLPLAEMVERLGRELLPGLEPGFGLTLVGIERREYALPLPPAVAPLE